MTTDPGPGRVLIVCGQPCRLALVLGGYQPATAGSAEVITVGGRPVWQHREANVALWRFVINHFGHRTDTVDEGATHFADGTPIPADLRLVELNAAARSKRPDDLTVREYTWGWPGRPLHPAVAGPSRYSTVHPQPEPPVGDRLEHRQVTLRPGAPAAPSIDRPLHIPGWTRPCWLDYLLHYTSDVDSSTLATITATTQLLALDDTTGLDEWDVDAAQAWACRVLEAGIDEDDLRQPAVTEWRPVGYGDTAGCVPLFDTTGRGRLPWTDLAPATGSRHQPRHTTPVAIAGNADPGATDDHTGKLS